MRRLAAISFSFGACAFFLRGVECCQILNKNTNERVIDVTMGFRFRKSVKIAPGVKVNFGKKSVGLSIGNKGGGISFNSKTGSRARVSIPGTGLSYSTKLGGRKKKSSGGKRHTSTSKKHTPTSQYSSIQYTMTSDSPKCLRWWYILLIILFLLSGIENLATNSETGLVTIGIAVIMGWFTLRELKQRQKYKAENNDKLLKLQKLVIENSPDVLTYSGAQLYAIAEEKSANSFRIANECSSILQTTVDPDTFFERLQLFSTHCRSLVDYEEYISFSGATPTELYNTLILEKQELIKEFLVRYFTKVDTKANGLKTAKGQLNQYQRFYDSLTPYFSEMDADNIDFIETKYKAYTRLLTNKA